MELEGDEYQFGVTKIEAVDSEDELMLQCTSLPSQTVATFSPALQMDLQARPMMSSQNRAVVEQCEQSVSVGCHSISAVLDNHSTSPESLLHSTSVSPSVDDDHDPEAGLVETITISDGQPVQHWSYEEQFRQLYNLSPEPERKHFLDKLFSFMQKKGTPITRIPIMAKQPLDMYKLFKLVVERGGLVEVIKKKAWRDIAKELNLPASITSAAFTMRSQYVKYLYPFECEEKKLSDPKELQLAIESNKRDRRHSDNIEFLPNSRENDRRDNPGQQPPFTVAGGAGTPSALQLITSPTVAIPQASIPPYSGGFILAPTAGGAHMVHAAPRLGPAGPQLVQMSSSHPHVPIIVPTSLSGNPPSFTTMIPVKPDILCSPNTALNVQRERKAEETPSNDDSSPVWNTSMPNLIQVNHKPNESLIPTVLLDRRQEEASNPDDSDDEPPPLKKPALDPNNSSSSGIATSTAQTPASGMPFTNISIKPAVSGVTSTESSPSVLVTLELNNTVYQGVLFARPKTSNSPSR